MHLLRYRNSSSDVMSVGVLRRDTISAIPGVTSLAQLWCLSREDLKAAVTGATGAEGKLADVAVAAPVDGCTEVWARGVTRADHRGGPRASGDELAGGRDRRCWPADSRAPRSGHTSGGVVTIASVDGPYPAATDPLHTSVGAAAIRRWLRPISYQDVPEELLPVDLRDGDTTVPRRIDGDLVLPALPPDTPPAGS